MPRGLREQGREAHFEDSAEVGKGHVKLLAFIFRASSSHKGS